MADEEKPATPASVKEAQQHEEKEQDTAASPGTPELKTPVPPTGSKPSSARSTRSVKPGSAQSAKSPKPGSGQSGKSGASTGSKGKGVKATPRSASPAGKSVKSNKSGKSRKGKTPDEAPLVETPVTTAPAEPDEQELPDVLPEGCVPIFLATKTQEIFSVRMDEDIKSGAPYRKIPKDELLKDIFNRAAVSDFQPFKKTIEEYPEDEMLIGYDADFKHGQNFVICTKVEAKEELLKKPEGVGEGGEGGGEGEEEEEDTTVYTYIPPTPKDWATQGSEIEIDEESLVENRKRLKMTSRRVRRDFGAPVTFLDRNAGDAKDGYVECAPYQDPNYDLKKLELDKATQAIPDIQDQASQTDWRFPRQASTQYTAREFTEEERQAELNNTKLHTFLDNVFPRFELAMQQNEIVDIFFDDWKNLGDDDGTFGVKSDTHLKEYQSFTDLQFSKDKTITCIDWHPSIKGVVGVSVGEQYTYDARIDNAGKVIMTPSLILIWSFTDPIHPQLLLEAPDDIYTFKFCPTDPHIIAGGCINGQVVLWDISKFSDRLKTQRGGNKRKTLNTLEKQPGFEDENALETPIVRYCAVSSIEFSHRAPISDLLWVPDHMEINRMGVPQENKSGSCAQVMTCAVDHSVLVWDIRPPKTAQQQGNKKEIDSPVGVSTTFRHLNLSWKPLLKITLPKSEPGGDHSPTKFSISERQREVKVKDAEKKEGATGDHGYGFKPGSAGIKKTLKHVKTHFYVGTEDGEIVYVDWMPQKDQDTGKIQTPKADYYHTLHDGPIVTLQRSPFFSNVVLLVGGWTFSIWKEGVTTGPILQSNASTKKMTGGHWSNSRPGVFFITKQDGTLDVWDLLDRTHEPSMSQSITPAAITTIFPWQVTNKQHLLAIGDNLGTLHILEIPWSLRLPTPNEMSGVSNYFDREVKRCAFVQMRWDLREKEKIRMEHEAKAKAGIAPQIQLTEEEVEQRMKMEYHAYTEEEDKFLRALGLKEEAPEVLPPID